jgi:tryptophan-rich sensory protein
VRERPPDRDKRGLIVALALCFAVAGVIRSQVPGYWVFAPAIYTAMAVAAWLVWRKVGFEGGRVPLGLFAVQLALELVFRFILFFGMPSPGLAFAVVVALWVSILLTLVAFGRVSLTAGVLMVPIWLGVRFAAYVTLWALAWSSPNAH